MNILLTGVTGFIGKNLSRTLSDAGHSVSGIIRSTSAVNDILTSCNLFTYDGTYSSVVNAFERSKPDIVIHLATKYLSTHTSDDVESLVESNILFGTFILEAMRNSGCSMIINTGTRWQHFNDKPYSAVNFYSATKQAFSDILEFYTSTYGYKALTLELSDTYGPGDTRGKIVDLLGSALRDNKCIDLSPGGQLLDLVYIDDVSTAFLKAIDIAVNIPFGLYQTYTVSSLEQLSLKEIGCIAEQVFVKKNLLNWGGKQYRDNEVMKPCVFFPNLPDWRPAVNLRHRLFQYYYYFKKKSSFMQSVSQVIAHD